MKLTLVLQKQHLGRMFKFNWLVKKSRLIPIDTKIVERLESEGIKVEDAKDVAYDLQPVQTLPEVKDELEPSVYTLSDENVLLEGLKQASVLLRTVIHSEQISTLAELPETFVSKDEEIAIKRSIAYAHLYDAHQVRLPRRVNPERKMWVYPRDYGVTERRKFELIMGSLYNKIETRFGPQICNHRMVVSDGLCKTSLAKEGKSLHFEQQIDYLWTSDQKLQPLVSQTTSEKIDFPDLQPLSSTISLIKKHVPQNEPGYPVNANFKFGHPHTAIAFYSTRLVRNIFEEPVTDSQYYARTLTKAFTVAASRAQQLYGPDVKTLPEPIVVQAVQTDGKEYHFGIYQLNSLDLDEGEPNHFWFRPERISLFEMCDYVRGKPVLSGYNAEIFDLLTAFYTNGNHGKVVPHSYYESSIENVAS